jgi:hypothetical protein
MRQIIALRVSRLAALTAGLTLFAGCQQKEFGMHVDVPAKNRTALAEIVQSEIRMAMPDQPFNIHSRRSAQTPGATGQARGESDARPDGRAFCQATATGGGTSWGEFQLGHALHNGSGVTVRMTVKLDIEYEQNVQADQTKAGETLADFTLKAYLKDAKGKLLHREVLANLSSDDGIGVRTGRQQLEFDAVLQPAMAYDLVIAGRASAVSEEGTRAQARIDIKQLDAELVCRPAAQENG